MADYWTSFAAAGDPNGPGRPAWPEFGAEPDRLLEFTNHGPVAGPIPLADRLDATPWMGVRPCTPDMLPIIGQMPGQDGAWCAFGHAHQGLTLGPTTGRLLAGMMLGEAPFVTPEPYRPSRF